MLKQRLFGFEKWKLLVALAATLALLAAGLGLLNSAKTNAMPPGGPGSKGEGTITIDDSHAYPGGYIVYSGTGLKKSQVEYLSCKLLLTPSSATSDKEVDNGWYQLNWTNPDGLHRDGETVDNVTYSAVAQSDADPSNDTVNIHDDKIITDGDAVSFTAQINLPTGIAPDLYYSQCLGGASLAIGSSFYVTKGFSAISISPEAPQPGDEITITVSNFATGDILAWDGVSGSKITASDTYPQVEISLDGQVIGSAEVTRDPDTGETTGSLTTTLSSDYASTDIVKIQASQGSRSASYELDFQNRYYTVDFDSAGGTLVPQQRVLNGQVATRPEDPTRVGYTFKGWTLDGQSYDFSQPVTQSLTLSADWEEVQPTGRQLTINGDNSASAEAGQTVTLQAYQFFASNGTVAFGIDDTHTGLGIRHLDANGSATLNVQLPADLPSGDYRIVAVNQQWEAEAKLTIK